MEKGWVISGYASVFGVIDTHNDVVVKGAFKNTESRKVKLLWQHDVTKPIGIISLLKEDEYGLLLEAEININTVAGAEAAELIKQKAVAGLSISFSINSSDYNKEGSRVISDIELREISIVTFPANQHAEIQYIKEIDIAEPLLEQKKLNELAKLVKQIENY